MAVKSIFNAPWHERIKFVIVPILLGFIGGLLNTEIALAVVFVLTLVWSFWFRWESNGSN